MVHEVTASSLLEAVTIDTYTLVVVSATGFIVGQHIRIIEPLSDKYYFGTILNIVSNTITVDSPFDYPYAAGSEVTVSNTNMAVNGSVTPVKYVLRTGSPSIVSAIDITRLMICCECSSAVDLNKFGDLAPLTRGLLLRRRDGYTKNVFNIKANRDMVGMGVEWNTFIASNPAQGIHGFSWRLTFAGQDRIGVVLRIGQDENLEVLVQDDLSTLVSLHIILEGHVVVD